MTEKITPEVKEPIKISVANAINFLKELKNKGDFESYIKERVNSGDKFKIVFTKKEGE